MSNRGSEFFGAIFKAIACTPNLNNDPAAYAEGAVQPARQLRKMMELHGENLPSVDEIRQAMELLVRILETKRVEPAERDERLKEVIERAELHEIFPKLAEAGHRS